MHTVMSSVADLKDLFSAKIAGLALVNLIVIFPHTLLLGRGTKNSVTFVHHTGKPILLNVVLYQLLTSDYLFVYFYL